MDGSQRLAVAGEDKVVGVRFPAEELRLFLAGRRVVQAGALLRCLLYGDPVARFIIDVLTDLGSSVPVPMSDLVRHAAARDRTLTPVIFFKPEAVPRITDDQGRVVWDRVQPEHYRSTTFFQYKSVLKHAGVLAPHALGGASARDYNPEADIWELAR